MEASVPRGSPLIYPGSPKQILGRVWFDHLPKNRSDDVTIAIFFGGGIGIYDKGSA